MPLTTVSTPIRDEGERRAAGGQLGRRQCQHRDDGDAQVKHHGQRQRQDDGARHGALHVLYLLGDIDHVLEADEGIEGEKRTPDDTKLRPRFQRRQQFVDA
jgi:hypothetical protein